MNKIKKAWDRMFAKVENMSSEELKHVWSIQDFSYSDCQFWDAENNITMEDWQQALYSELGNRGIPAI